MTIKKATVLGAGTMGSQIAALLVNAGLQVKLLDLVVDENDPNKLSQGAFDKIVDKRKGQLYTTDFAGNLTYGNFTDDLVEDSDSDLFVEAVSEKIEIKHDLWSKVAKIAKKDAILATNTSGIPIKDIAEVLDEDAKGRFLGFHFFNPPRFMKLVEIIPHVNTDPKVTQRLKDFTINILGKGVVEAEDVSGFVGNRIGVYSLIDVMIRAEKEGLSVEEVDAITGKLIGRPKTATYKLVDFVGVDIAYHVAKGMIANPEEESFFSIPESIQKLMDLGFLGKKSKQGYYKKLDRKTTVVFDGNDDYREKKDVSFDFVNGLGRSLPKNLKAIFESDDKIAKFLWESLANVMYYSAINVPKATQDYKNIDRAMVWGYNWDLGPFQLWDTIGFEVVRDRLREMYGELPAWIEERTGGFYQAGEGLSQVKGLQEFVSETVWSKENIGDLYVTDNKVLIYTLRTPNNTITSDLSDDLIEAVNTLENSDYRGMVLYSEGRNFSVGANLVDISKLIKEGKGQEVIPAMVDSLHDAVYALKHANKPIVSAARGQALGGGTELLLYSPFVVTASELYMGLVEVGVGLIPSGGGLAEMAERIYSEGYERAEEIKQLSKVFKNIAFGKVSSNAYEAKRMGYLRDTDVIINNEELVLEVAIKKVEFESSYNYHPITPKTFAAEGSNFYGIALADLNALKSGNFASEYDVKIGSEIASVISGGDVPLGTLVNQRYLMSLEKRSFLSLCAEEKTLQRMEHMLKTKRPLRN